MPLVFLGLIVALLPAGTVLPKQFGDIEAIGLFVVLGVYSAAVHTSGRSTLVAGALTFVLYVATMATDRDGVNIAGVIFFALVFGGLWVAGRAIRHRRDLRDRVQAVVLAYESGILRAGSLVARSERPGEEMPMTGSGPPGSLTGGRPDSGSPRPPPESP